MQNKRPWKPIALLSVLMAMALLAGCQQGLQTESEDPTAEGTETAEDIRAPKLPATAANPPAVIPAGTPIRIRTTTTLSTKSVASGEGFVGSLEEPLMDGERVVAAKGATVRGKVVESDPGGRVKGRAKIAIRVTEIDTPAGPVGVTTRSHTVVAQASKKDDAVKVGVGAGIGAAIGAIAGGGSGAAKGAGVGAGAGTGAVLATRGKAAVIPAESVISLALNEDLTVELP